MKESQYIQQIRQLVKEFKAADQQRKETEGNAEQTYKSQKEAAEAEFQTACEEADKKLTTAKEAQQSAYTKINRVNIPYDTPNIVFQPPSPADTDSVKEFANSVATATETARKIQEEVETLQRLRDERAREAQRRRERYQQLVIAAGIAAVILVFIVGFAINRVWKNWKASPHYIAAVEAMEAKNWEKAREELNQVLSIDESYKDAQILLRESYYQPALIALETQNWEKAQSEAESLIAIDANYKDVQVKLAVAEALETMEFVLVSEGCFQMGSPETEKGQSSDEGPVHEVCVDGFWMGKYEVTQAQWEKVMGNNPAHFNSEEIGTDSGNHPVEQVSWNDVQEFISTLNEQVGENIYRLPTEAEWEYAARAGTQTAYSFGDNADKLNEYAWYSSNSGSETHPVGQLNPNAFGLYDMHGNVWEWCKDIYESDAYKSHQRNNPVNESGGPGRVLRGGSWSSYPWFVRCANRNGYGPSGRDNYGGFRLVREN